MYGVGDPKTDDYGALPDGSNVWKTASFCVRSIGGVSGAEVDAHSDIKSTTCVGS